MGFIVSILLGIINLILGIGCMICLYVALIDIPLLSEICNELCTALSDLMKILDDLNKIIN